MMKSRFEVSSNPAASNHSSQPVEWPFVVAKGNRAIFSAEIGSSRVGASGEDARAALGGLNAAVDDKMGDVNILRAQPNASGAIAVRDRRIEDTRFIQ